MKRKTYTIRRADQRQAVASPTRMELLGLFVGRESLSVAEIAERMGRPPSAVHYHVGVLEKTALLQRVGKRRAGRRTEALFRPVADLFMMEHQRDGGTESARAALKTLASAFRMAERDLEAAFTDPDARSQGPYRNVYGSRLHLRMSKADLKELNRHLRAIESIATRLQRKHEPSPNDVFLSLTLALAPLRDRKAES
jgi:predicted ArsR family transcriptional regulator